MSIPTQLNSTQLAMSCVGRHAFGLRKYFDFKAMSYCKQPTCTADETCINWDRFSIVFDVDTNDM
jgi:hypothetical protein